MPAEGATHNSVGAPGGPLEGTVQNRPTGVAISATYVEDEGWQLSLHRAFTDDQARVSVYRCSYRGLSGAELVSMIDVELDDLAG